MPILISESPTNRDYSQSQISAQKIPSLYSTWHKKSLDLIRKPLVGDTRGKNCSSSSDVMNCLSMDRAK